MTRMHTNTTKWITAEPAGGVSRVSTQAPDGLRAFAAANATTSALAKGYVR